VLTVFVENIDFISDRNDADLKMNKILKTYIQLYEATRGVVQFEKMSYF